MIKSVCIETRPALRCSHVCIVLKKKIKSSVRIRLRKSEISLEVNDRICNVAFEDFTAIPLSLTGLKVTEKFLNFRIQIESTFKLKSFAPYKLDPPFRVGDKATLTCNCFNLLTKEIVLERVLPLPSTDLTFSDMFCHLHEKTPENCLSPRPSDCFFSDQVISLNGDVIIGCYKNGKFIKCKRCLATVGSERNKCIVFWTSCLNFPSNVTPLQRLQNLVWKVVSDPFSLFPHILLESEETENYLSVIIIDKNLILSECRQDLKLSSQQVMKIKYMYYPSLNDEVKSLKNDPFNNLFHVRIDKYFLNYTLKYLTSSSKNMPSVFSKTEEANMAYLNLTEQSFKHQT